jgi:hypothetical protein
MSYETFINIYRLILQTQIDIFKKLRKEMMHITQLAFIAIRKFVLTKLYTLWKLKLSKSDNC